MALLKEPWKCYVASLQNTFPPVTQEGKDVNADARAVVELREGQKPHKVVQVVSILSISLPFKSISVVFRPIFSPLEPNFSPLATHHNQIKMSLLKVYIQDIETGEYISVGSDGKITVDKDPYVWTAEETDADNEYRFKDSKSEGYIHDNGKEFDLINDSFDGSLWWTNANSRSM